MGNDLVEFFKPLSLYYHYFYSYTRKRFYWVTFKLEDIHRPKFCATTFFICHYTDIGNGECQPRIGLFNIRIKLMEQLSEIALFENRFKSYLSDIALQFYVYGIKNLPKWRYVNSPESWRSHVHLFLRKNLLCFSLLKLTLLVLSSFFPVAFVRLLWPFS